MLSRLPLAGLVCTIALFTPLASMPAMAEGAIAQNAVEQTNQEADRLLQLGTKQYETAEYDASLVSLQQALTLYQKANHVQGQASTLTVLANLYIERQQDAQALKAAQEAVKLSQGNQQLTGWSSMALGRTYLVRSDQQSVELLKQSLAIARSIQDTKLEGWSLQILSNLYRWDQTVGTIEQARLMGEQSLALAQQLGDRRLEGRSLLMIGQAISGQKKDAEAIEVYRKSLTVAEAVGDRRTMLNTLTGMANSQKVLQKYPEAIASLQKVGEIAETFKIPSFILTAPYTIGDIYRDTEQYEKAVVLYQKALAIAKQQNNLTQEYNILFDMAATYSRQGDNGKSIMLREQALDAAQRSQDTSRIADAYQKLGSALSLMNKNQEALLNYQKALELHRQQKSIQEEVQTSVLIIESLTVLQRYQEAIALSQQGLQQFKQPAQQFSLWNQLAVIYARNKEQRKEVEARQEALKAAQMDENTENLASAYQRLGLALDLIDKKQEALLNYQKAIALYQQQKNIQKEEQTSIWAVDALMDLQRYQEAITLAQQGLQKFKKPAQQFSLWSSLAAAYSRTNNKLKSVEARKEALSAAKLDKSPGNMAEAYRKLGAALSSANQNQQALVNHQKAIELYKEMKDPQGEFDTLILLIEVNNNMDRYDQSILAGNQLLEIAPKLKNVDEAKNMAVDKLSDSYLFMGVSHGEKKQYAKALEAFQEIQKLAKQHQRSILRAKALVGISYNYQRQALPKQAIETLQSGLALAEKESNQDEIAELLSELSLSHYRNKEYKSMLKYATQAYELNQAQIKGEKSEKTRLDLLKKQGQNLLPRLALAHQLLKDYPQAIEFRKLAIANAETRNDLKEVYGARLQLVNTFTEIGQGEQAVIYAESFLTQVQGDPWQGVLIYSSISIAYNSTGDYLKAINASKQAHTLAKRIENETIQGHMLNAWSEIHLNNAEPKITLDIARQALELGKKLDNSEIQIFALANMGRAYNELENYPKAIENLQAGIAIAEESKNLTQQARLSLILGLVYFSDDNIAKSLEVMSRAQKLSKDGDKPLVGATANTLKGLGCLKLGSSSCSQENASLFSTEGITSLKDLEGIQALQKFMESYALFTQGDYQKSLPLAEDCLIMAQKLKNIDLIRGAYFLLSYNYAELGNDKKSVSMAKQGFALARKTSDISSGALALAEIYRKFRQVDQAAELYQRSIALNPEKAGDSYSGLARIYRQSNPELAIAYYKQSVNQIEKFRQKNKSLSKDLQASFLQSIQGLGKVKVVDIYRELADLLLKNDRILEARQVIELLKLQELDDYNRETRGPTSGPITPVSFLKAETELLDAFNKRVAEKYTSIFQITQELETLRKPDTNKTPAIQKRIRELEALESQAQGIIEQFLLDPTIKEYVANLKRTDKTIEIEDDKLNQLATGLASFKQSGQTAAIFYPIVFDDRLELLLIPSKGAPLRRTVKIDRITLNNAINQFGLDLTDATSNPKLSGQQLYQWLVQPIEADLKEAGINTLIYSPDRKLRSVPLAALYDGQQWLIEKYQISHITATSATNLTTRRDAPPKVLSGTISDKETTTYNVKLPDNTEPYKFQGLAAGKIELSAIGQAISGSKNLIENDFSSDRLRDDAGQYNILHLATHGYFDFSHPENSFLLFSQPDSQGKNYATITDIRKWKLSGIDLVTLSACQTAVAPDKTDSKLGILGISHEFERAGARSTIASLWRVNDRSTALFMQSFYQNLSQGKTKAEALKNAQTTMLRLNTTDTVTQAYGRLDRSLSIKPTTPLPTTTPKPTGYSHPYYWAPFILIGNSL
jgi:CHAT domain-containing protein